MGNGGTMKKSYNDEESHTIESLPQYANFQVQCDLDEEERKFEETIVKISQNSTENNENTQIPTPIHRFSSSI
jgi:hypothetical protein